MAVPLVVPLLTLLVVCGNVIEVVILVCIERVLHCRSALRVMGDRKADSVRNGMPACSVDIGTGGVPVLGTGIPTNRLSSRRLRRLLAPPCRLLLPCQPSLGDIRDKTDA